ncbi:MAG: hypothetical protein WA667_03690 [Candidatus Nitrosopolaris sp.]
MLPICVNATTTSRRVGDVDEVILLAIILVEPPAPVILPADVGTQLPLAITVQLPLPIDVQIPLLQNTMCSELGFGGGGVGDVLLLAVLLVEPSGASMGSVELLFFGAIP